MSQDMDQRQLARIPDVIRADIGAGDYHGAVIMVARGGEVALEAAIGSADLEQKQPLALDSVFNIFSVTKAFTNLLVLQAVERGRFALTTPISALIPEFKGRGREKVLMWHLLSHQAGFPIIFEVQPGWYIDNFAEVARTVIAEVAPVDAETFARFLGDWHGVSDVRQESGAARLLEIIAQLEGVPIAISELEARVLPARLRGYQPRLLDELMSTGQAVWVGAGALGNKDGRVVLYRREGAAELLRAFRVLPDGGVLELPQHLGQAFTLALVVKGTP